MCLYPVKVRNKKYSANKKNGGVIPTALHGKMYTIGASCGNCIECRKMKGREWRIRIGEEIRDRKDGKMVTLTFNDEWLNELRLKVNEKRVQKLSGWDLDNQVCVYAVRQFSNRYIFERKRQKKNHKSLRRWLVTELGSKNDRIHMHGIVFTDMSDDDLQIVWKYGHIHIPKNGFVSDATVNYISKYFTKVDFEHKGYKPRMMRSPGMGLGYVERNKRRHAFRGEDTVQTYRTRQGVKLPLPMYYREKLWSDEEREELWYHKILEDKQYVAGYELSESQENFETEYSGALESGRRRSERLGYGKRDKNWDMKRFDREGRMMREKWKKAKQGEAR